MIDPAIVPPATDAAGLTPRVLWIGFESPLPDDVADELSHEYSDRFGSRDLHDSATFAIVYNEQRWPTLEAYPELAAMVEGADGATFRPRVFAVSPAGIDPAFVAGVRAAVASGTAARLQSLARRNFAITRELSEVRHLHENLQAAFERVEHFVHESGLNTPKVLVELPPTETIADNRPVLVPRDEPARLVLPYELNRVSAISLWLEVLDGGSRAADASTVHVSLVSARSGQRFSHWAVPASKLHKGNWTTLLVDSLPIAYGHLVAIELQMEGPAKIAILTSKQSVAGASIQVPGKQPGTGAGAFPAIKLWSGLAGTRVAHSLDMAPFEFETRSPAPNRRVKLNWSKDEVQQVHVPDTRISQPMVEGLPGPLVSVHPADGGPVIARLDTVLPEGEFQVESQVAIHHEKGQGTLFRLAIAENDQEAIDLLCGDASADGWSLATPDKPNMARTASNGKAGRLYLATRIPSGGTSAYAWARFGDTWLVF